jgi:hypothetical protein
MTIQYSMYTDAGIVFAADSNITRMYGGKTVVVRRDDKVLTVPRVGVHRNGGVIGYYGLAQVGGTPMTAWLRNAISKWPGSRSAADFTEHLRLSLSASLRPDERKTTSGFHIGAYEQRNRFVVPVFWHLWNYRSINVQTREYFGNVAHRGEEQLLGRDFAMLATKDLRSHLRSFQVANGLPHWYRNGDLPFLSPITNVLQTAIQHINSTQPKRYQSPSDIEGWRRLLLSLS